MKINNLRRRKSEIWRDHTGRRNFILYPSTVQSTIFMTSRTSLPFPIEWGNENQLRRSFEKSKSTPTSIRHFTRRRSKSDEEDDSDVLLGDVIQTRNPLSWNITTNVSPSPASTISQSPSSTPALTYTTASEEHAQLQEHFRDETFRLKLDLKSTNHELTGNTNVHHELFCSDAKATLNHSSYDKSRSTSTRPP